MGNACSGRINQTRDDVVGGEATQKQATLSSASHRQVKFQSVLQLPPVDVMAHVLSFLGVIEYCATTIHVSKWFRSVTQVAFARVKSVHWEAAKKKKIVGCEKILGVSTPKTIRHEFSAGLTRVICRLCKNLEVMQSFCGTVFLFCIVWFFFN